MATQLNNNGHKGIDALLEGEENITAGANAALDPTYKILNIGKAVFEDIENDPVV